MRQRNKRLRVPVLYTAILALVVAACGGSEGTTTTGSAADLTTTAPAPETTTQAESTTIPGEEQSATTQTGGNVPPEAQPLEETVVLSINALPSLSLGVLYVAAEMGFFEDENLDVMLGTIQNSQDAVTLLAQGELDAIVGSISAGLFNSIDSGLDVRAVTAVSTTAEVPGAEEEPPPSGVFVRADLHESGEVTSYQDMAGRTVASPGGMGAATSYLIALYLEAGGLTLDDIELAPLGVADSLTALENGSVDIAFLTSPYAQDAVASGGAVELGSAREIYGDETQSAVMFGPTLLEENRQAGVAFVRALLRAAEEMQGDYRQNDEVVAALSAGLDIEEDFIRSAPPYFVPSDLQFNADTARQAQQIFLDQGDLLSYSNPLSIDEIYAVDMYELGLNSLDN